jgi:hypothetical protein
VSAYDDVIRQQGVLAVLSSDVLVFAHEDHIAALAQVLERGSGQVVKSDAAGAPVAEEGAGPHSHSGEARPAPHAPQSGDGGRGRRGGWDLTRLAAGDSLQPRTIQPPTTYISTAHRLGDTYRLRTDAVARELGKEPRAVAMAALDLFLRLDPARQAAEIADLEAFTGKSFDPPPPPKSQSSKTAPKPPTKRKRSGSGTRKRTAK